MGKDSQAVGTRRDSRSSRYEVLLIRRSSWYSVLMTTVAEIERAIGELPPDQVKELGEWLDDYQLMLFASSAVFDRLDAEEGKGEQWSEQTPHAEKSGL